jgi:hypothetical protein
LYTAIKICGSLLYSLYLFRAECSSLKEKFLSLDQMWDKIAIMSFVWLSWTNVSRYSKALLYVWIQIFLCDGKILSLQYYGLFNH